MTIEAMNEFAAAVRADNNMADNLSAAIGDRAGHDAAKAVAEFAGERGFAVTPHDVEAAHRSSGGAEGAISDQELEAVSGGLPLFVYSKEYREFRGWK